MLRALLYFLLFIGSVSLQAQALLYEGDEAFKSGKYAKAKKYYLKQYKNNFNEACAYKLAKVMSITQAIDSAFYFLHKCVRLDSTENLLVEAEFYALQADRRWTGVERRQVKKICAHEGCFGQTEYALALLRLQTAHSYYQTYDPDAAEFAQLLESMLELIERFGWPKRKEVGLIAASTFPMMLQYADEQQLEKFLPHYREQVRKNENVAFYLPLLEDRLAVLQHRPQRYGTQWHTENGRLSFYPIQGLEEVNKLRSEYNLFPISIFEHFLRSKQ